MHPPAGGLNTSPESGILLSMAVIEAQKRAIFGKKLKNLRSQGKIPAVMYGPKEEAMAILVDQKEFKKVLSEAGESSVVTLRIGEDEHETLIYDVGLNPITDEPTHADFYIFEKGKLIQTHVQLEFTGVAPGVREYGGTLVKIMHELEVEALPRDLPKAILVPLELLTKIGSQIAVRDLKVEKGVTVLASETEIIASVAAPREEKIEEEPAAIDLTKIEVEKKGKKLEEGEETGTTEEKTGEKHGEKGEKRDAK